MAPPIASIVIVGAGQAGASAAAKLRQLGFDGSIDLIGNEPELPYQRPPLSKKYLTGELDAERLLLHPHAFYAERNITLHLGTTITDIDRDRSVIRLADLRELRYDRLLLATGAAPRHLPTAMITGEVPTHTVRSRADADRLRPAFSGSRSVLIIGGGYIGLEIAASARRYGLVTTLLEAAPRILQRVAAPATSQRFTRLHQDNGVDVRTGVKITGLSASPGGGCTATLSDGMTITADLAVIGIGVAPATAVAERANLLLDNGIAVDALCTTSDPAIFAAGDCASFPLNGTRIRLESVQNAHEQAEAAAVNMLGGATPYAPVPWFWSDQYDVKLQIAGLNTGYDQVIERTGARAGTGSAWYFANGRFIATDAYNDAAAFMVAKRLLEAGLSPPPDQIADPAIPLKSFLASAR